MFAWTDPFLEDLSGFRGNYGLISTYDGLRELIDKLGSSEAPVAFDIETGYTGPDTPKGSLDAYLPNQFIVGFSLTNDTSWARYVPLKHDYAANLDPNAVWPMVQPLLEQSALVCHNWAFEARNLRTLDWKGDGPRIELDWRKAHDSMIQSYVLSETQRHGLKELTMLRYSYEQAHIDSLFDKKLTEEQLKCLRFNVLGTDPQVVNYVCDDVCWALRLDADQRSRCETERGLIYQIEREVMGILLDMAETGMAVDWEGIVTDLGRFDYFYQQMESRTRRLFQEAVGRDLTALNFRSPVQMRQLLFEDLGLRSTRLTPPNRNGEQSLSTDETALEALRHQHPAVEQLLKYRQVKKMGEWFQLWAGLRTSVDERVHPVLNQVRGDRGDSGHAIQSGRFSSDRPNVQNITKKWWFTLVDRDFEAFPATDDGDAAFEAHVKSTGVNGIDYWTGNARNFLVATPGYRLLLFDYQAAEMRVLAGLSEEPYLLQAFAQDRDVHAVAAALAFHVPLASVTPEQRQRAKGVQFGLVYGQGPKGLADALGIPQGEASAIIDQYFAAFTKVQDWFDKVKREGHGQGYVLSFLGRKSTLWDLQNANPKVRAKADRMMVNIPVQGGAADYTKLAMIRARRGLVERGWWGTQVRLLMNQHDSLVFEVAEDLSLVEVRDFLEPLVSFALPAHLPCRLPPMVVDWEYGQRWGSMARLTDTEPARVPEVSVPPPEPTEELDLGVEMVLRFAEKPTDDTARRLLALLREHPGTRPVRIALGEREVPVRGTLVDPGVVALLRDGFGCGIELRPVAYQVT